MCESCCGNGLPRREFLQLSTAGLAAVGLTGVAVNAMAKTTAQPPTKPEKKPTRIAVVFMYPPDEVVQAGKLEGRLAPHHWYTWPGNQFEPDKKRVLMTEKIQEACAAAGVVAEFHPEAIYNSAKVKEYIARVKDSKPDALLVVNFWNTFAAWSLQIAQGVGAPAIVYQPVGSSHQLPSKPLLEAKNVYFIHSVDNWTELAGAIHAVNARTMLAQSRLLRISSFKEISSYRDKHLNVEHICVPAEEYNDMFDGIKADEKLINEAMAFKKAALRVADVTDAYLIDAFRAHRAVLGMMARYGADSVTIKCLLLENRKPCVSFALNNGSLTPCACEDFPDSAMTLMLGRWLFGRGGFMHNPDYDVNDNRYYGSHCTCPVKMHGPSGSDQKYWIRPFFHHLPKSAALDVEWTPEEPVFVTKYVPDQKLLSCWAGKVVESPLSTTAGGCATRVLVNIDKVDDVCSIHVGPHPVLFCGSPKEARRIKMFARLCDVSFKGNI